MHLYFFEVKKSLEGYVTAQRRSVQNGYQSAKASIRDKGVPESMSYSSFNYPSVKRRSNRLNKLLAYKSAGKRQSGRKQSTPILVLPFDTCCSLLFSIYTVLDRGTICPFSRCEKTKLQAFPQRKTKWKSRFSAK